MVSLLYVCCLTLKYFRYGKKDPENKYLHYFNYKVLYIKASYFLQENSFKRNYFLSKLREFQDIRVLK